MQNLASADRQRITAASLRVALLCLYGACLPREGLAAAGPAARGSEPGQTYRWKDADGVTHYGDHVPQQYSQGAVAVMSRDGVTVREQPPRLSEAEAIAARERAQASDRQRRHDRFLLVTYSSEREIAQLRDERVTQITAQITASEAYLVSLGRRLESLRARVGNFRPYAANANAPRMPDALAAEIVRTLADARSQRSSLVTRQKELEEVRASFDADIKRYQQLLVSQGLR